MHIAKKIGEKMSELKKLALMGGTPSVNEKFPKWPQITDEDVREVVSTLQTYNLSAYEVIDGPLFDFELELREQFHVKYALLVGSGTAALQSAAFAIDLKPGDEIIVPTITFPGTASVFLYTGASVKFVDVDKYTGNPTFDQIKEAIGEKTKAVVVAHAWGISAEVDVMKKYLSEKNIVLIEDSARALGSQCNSIPVGTIGDIGCFSFHELKMVPAGEGGVFLTNNREYYERAVALGHYFRSKEKYHISTTNMARYQDSSLGLNLKIHPLAASLARSQFSRLDSRISNMKINYEKFEGFIQNSQMFEPLRIPKWANRISHYGFNFLRKCDNDMSISLNTLIVALRAEGISATKIGNPPLFQMNLFKDSVKKGPLLGKVCGSINHEDFPESILHANLLCRLPNIYEIDYKWCNYYICALEKIENNIELLYKWETQNRR